ncbi:unnamed protein product [Blepharisma stoltei]|uniref:ELMO domain-containing protein n=1 Tax=Blepharisma stoltei TaxID=1481888 RepID=A0AAU9K5D9_9CILI|nr:unnamed protein product [Blepharisma stoltei]
MKRENLQKLLIINWTKPKICNKMSTYYRMADEERKLAKTQGVVDYYESCSDKCCRCGRYKLTYDEIEALNQLRSRCKILYNKDNAAHTEMLKQLWRVTFPELEPPEDCISVKWKEIGFQGTDPGTDFRGAGIFGLQQILYLATHYPQEYKQFIESATDYSFCISALNVTHFYMYYFQLLENRAVGIPGLRRAALKPMKVFCGLNLLDSDAINEIFVAAVFKMHAEWQELKKTRKVNVMNFPTVIIRAVNYVEDILYTLPQDIAKFKQLAFN